MSVQREVTINEAQWTEPAAVFRSLSGQKGVVWLDSGMDHTRLGVWSFIVWAPVITVSGAGETFVIKRDDITETVKGDPFSIVKNILAGWEAPGDPDHPPFTGGAAGFFGYDLLGHCEPSAKLVKSQEAAEGDLWLGFYEGVIAFDHENKRTLTLANLEPGVDPEPKLAAMREVLDRASYSPQPPPTIPAVLPWDGLPESNFTKEKYVAAVERVREYIEEGDCYQANISQRFSAPEIDEPGELYLRLRSINPAPFAAYIDTGKAQILSASPERFISLRDGRAQTRPIKGTMPRGDTEAEDMVNRTKLEKSGKDRAENVMIVDLLRNDLSKVCKPDSVKVTELCAAETFPTVFHLVSAIEGELKDGLGPVDLLKEAFPGGSVTGAPKIRAMEIIDELEPDPRGVYCGAIGYIGFNGVMDTSIVIRTIVRAGGRLTFHAGGGVTWLSGADAEYDETLDKARALIEAVKR